MVDRLIKNFCKILCVEFTKVAFCKVIEKSKNYLVYIFTITWILEISEGK